MHKTRNTNVSYHKKYWSLTTRYKNIAYNSIINSNNSLYSKITIIHRTIRRITSAFIITEN